MQQKQDNLVGRGGEDFRATFHTSSGVHPNLQPATGAIEHRWFDGLENASKDTGPNHPPYFDDVLRALERHGVWTGPQDPMSKYLGMYYARMGGRWGMDGKDYGYELTPQERYDEFMSALDQARTEHDAKQDKELQHSSKRQKSVIDMESSEWKVQSAVVSWFRGYMEIKKEIQNKAAETSTELNKR